MKVIEKIRDFVKPKNKNKVLIKSKFGLPAVRVCGIVLADGGPGAVGQSATGFNAQTNQQAAADAAAGFSAGLADSAGSSGPPTNQGTFAFAPKITGPIEEIYLANNEDVKDLIVNLVGVVAIGFGKANEQYESIRINYDTLSLNLTALIKIYSFTSGNKTIFAKNTKQKNEYSHIINSINISSINIIDLVNFE